MMILNLCSSLQVLLANFEPYHESGAAYNVTGVLTSLPTLTRGHITASNVTVTMYRVSETEANARLVWERMGRPSSLSDQQKYALTYYVLQILLLVTFVLMWTVKQTSQYVVIIKFFTYTERTTIIQYYRGTVHVDAQQLNQFLLQHTPMHTMLLYIIHD